MLLLRKVRKTAWVVEWAFLKSFLANNASNACTTFYPGFLDYFYIFYISIEQWTPLAFPRFWFFWKSNFPTDGYLKKLSFVLIFKKCQLMRALRSLCSISQLLSTRSLKIVNKLSRIFSIRIFRYWILNPFKPDLRLFTRNKEELKNNWFDEIYFIFAVFL